MQLSHLIAALNALPEVAREAARREFSPGRGGQRTSTGSHSLRSSETDAVLSRSANFRYDAPETLFRHENGENDMDVTSTGSVGGSGPVRPVQVNPAESTPSSDIGGLQAPQDEVEISSAARLLDQIQNDPQVRAQKLAEIRAAIAEGTYETPEKLSVAVERLLDEIRQSGD